MKIFRRLGIRNPYIGDIISVCAVIICIYGVSIRDGVLYLSGFGILILLELHEIFRRQQLKKTHMKSEREFVPYFIAIQLKELGFNEECFAYYAYPENGFDFVRDGRGTVIVKTNSEFGYACSAPLWQQVFRWFRDKHGYHGSVDSSDGIAEWKIASIHLEKAVRSGCIHAYDDAQLVCVEKLIEIIEYNNKSL